MGNGRNRIKSTVTIATKSNNNTHSGIVREKNETIFTDKATDSHGYRHFIEDPDIVRYFSDQSNINELIPKLTHNEKNDFGSWESGLFMGKSTYTWNDLSASRQGMLRTYDKYIDQSVFSENIAVRTLGGYSTLTGSRDVPSASEWNNIVNQPIKLRMPVSAAAASEGLTIGHSGKNAEYVWHVPKGTKGVAMPIVDSRINPGWASIQREVMMGRDVYWKPVSRVYNKSRGVWEIHMQYVGKDKHDYGKK